MGIYLASAIQDFSNARRRAELEALGSRLTGKSNALFSYEEVRRILRATSSSDRGLQTVPLDAIVGSVNRYTDFTRSFLPKQDTDLDRWARVQVVMTTSNYIPPIELYKIGDAYFVKDGNHRVSVARNLEAETIEAYVTEVYSPVPFSPDTQPDELILKAEYVDFLQRIPLKAACPDADLMVTAPGQYPILEEHIAVHRHFMGLEWEREIPLAEAVKHWYDTVYMPVIRIIRELAILRSFPNRTETDLYLWLANHKAFLEESLGWDIKLEIAAANLVEKQNENLGKLLFRAGGKLLNAVSPVDIEAGPEPGVWRKERVEVRHEDNLFSDILVALNGEESGWRTFDQALEIAKEEGATLQGLHVVPDEESVETKTVHDLRWEFGRRCAEAGVKGKFAVEVGPVIQCINARSYWSDLVVVSLNYPPGSSPVDKLKSGFRSLIQRASRPVLAVPCPLFPLNRALLAYDGSRKAREALFIATYLVTQWPDLSLVVLTVIEPGGATEDTLQEARDYLGAHNVEATYLIKEKPVADAILRSVQDFNSNLIIMGGYGLNPVLEAMFGSALDKVLRESCRPILICR